MQPITACHCSWLGRSLGHELAGLPLKLRFCRVVMAQHNKYRNKPNISRMHVQSQTYICWNFCKSDTRIVGLQSVPGVSSTNHSSDLVLVLARQPPWIWLNMLLILRFTLIARKKSVQLIVTLICFDWYVLMIWRLWIIHPSSNHRGLLIFFEGVLVSLPLDSRRSYFIVFLIRPCHLRCCALCSVFVFIQRSHGHHWPRASEERQSKQTQEQSNKSECITSKLHTKKGLTTPYAHAVAPRTWYTNKHLENIYMVRNYHCKIWKFSCFSSATSSPLLFATFWAASQKLVKYVQFQAGKSDHKRTQDLMSNCFFYVFKRQAFMEDTLGHIEPHRLQSL